MGEEDSKKGESKRDERKHHKQKKTRKEKKGEKKKAKKEKKEAKQNQKRARKVLEKAKKKPEKVNFDQVKELLEESDSETQRLAVSVFHTVGKSDVDGFIDSSLNNFSELVKHLNDEDEETKRKARWILRKATRESEGRTIYPEELNESLPYLKKFLRSDDLETRATAVELVRYVAGVYPKKVKDMRGTLEKLFNEERVRKEAAQTYGLIAAGDEEKRNAMMKRMVNRCSGKEDLSRMGAVEALKTVLEKEQLGGEGMEEKRGGFYAPAVNALIRRLDDENPRVRGHATEAVSIMTSRNPQQFTDLRPELIDVLREGEKEHEYEEARKYAARALGYVGEKEDVEEIKDAVDDASRAVRKEAEKAIERIEVRSR